MDNPLMDSSKLFNDSLLINDSSEGFNDQIIDSFHGFRGNFTSSFTEIQASLVKNETNYKLDLMKKLEEFRVNRAIDQDALIWLMLSYILLIAVGSIGNGLVCIAVIRKPAMRTPRNLFIINLAISDLTLCLITMPFSFIEIAAKFWSLGLFTCKLIAGLEATSIFVSTMSITAIALDRYFVIIKPTPETPKITGTIYGLLSIWIIALILSTPLFWCRTTYRVELPEILSSADHLEESFEYCYEEWPINKGRAIYSVFTIILQYFVPTILVTLIYMKIYKKLKHRMSQKRTAIKLDERIKVEERRTKRTNHLLISVSLIFGISWLPLNILNIISDLYYPFEDTSTFRIVFACCHMVGMSSACFNPLLYGWLNDNFQKEFKEIFALLMAKLTSICCCPCCPAKGSTVLSSRTATSMDGKIETTVVYGNGESHDHHHQGLDQTGNHHHRKHQQHHKNSIDCNSLGGMTKSTTDPNTTTSSGSSNGKKSLVVKQV